jgi:hypothetical protein
MRISALSSTLVFVTLVTLVAPAYAEHQAPRVAAASGPAREERRAPTLTTGDLALTGPAHAPRKEPFLAVADITAVVTPQRLAIERCYLDAIASSRRPGHLDLMFVIARDGSVVSLDIAAPGVPATAVHQIVTCIRETVAGLQFPARRNDTTAIVPYFFQRTDAPNAGPQLSCWNPKGC